MKAAMVHQIIVSLAVLAIVNVAEGTEFPRREIESVLPIGLASGELYRIEIDVECRDIVGQHYEFLRDNMKWWLSVVSATSRGDTVPYFSRYGLSRAEYKRLVSCGSALNLNFLGAVDLKISQPQQGRYALTAQGVQDEFPQIVIDLDSREVHWGQVVLTDWRVAKSDSCRILDGWEGVRWRSVIPGGLIDKTLVKRVPVYICSLGRYEDGRGFLEFSSGTNLVFLAGAGETFVVLYDLAGGETE